MSESFDQSAGKIVPRIFQEMLQIAPTRGSEPVDLNGQHCVAGIIGITGSQLMGFVALNFSKGVALRIASNMLGMEATEVNSDVKDACGEMVNVIVGNMKTDLSAAGVKFDISVPSVITGEGISITPTHDLKTYKIPFVLQDGTFYLEYAVKNL